MLDLNKIKKDYPQPEHTTYFNTSSTGLVSSSGIEKAHKFNENLHKFGSQQAEYFYEKVIPEIRETISLFIDAPIDEIALIPNFSFGLCAIIPSITSLKCVLLIKDDYPSLVQPFLLNNFDVYWIESIDGFSIDMEDMKKSIINNNIEILAISHVQFLTGFMIDVDELGAFCKQHGVLFILDGTQSFGTIPFSFNTSDVDIYIASNYKWMNAGFGTGIMCIKQATLNKYIPKTGGFHSYQLLEGQWKYKPSIKSYEPGHQNMSGLEILKDAIEFKMEVGMRNIANHNLNLLNRLIDKIEDTPCKLIGPYNNNNRCNIAGIIGAEKLTTYLKKHNIIVKERFEIIRIGIHFYNTEDDVDYLIETLRAY